MGTIAQVEFMGTLNLRVKTIGSKDTWAEYIKDLVASKCAKRGVYIGRNEFAATDSLDKSVDFFANHLK